VCGWRTCTVDQSQQTTTCSWFFDKSRNRPRRTLLTSRFSNNNKRDPMKLKLTRMLVAGTLGLASAQALAQSPTVTVTYSGTTYTLTSTGTNYDASSSLLSAQPWWGNAALAGL
jgi:hypothetical protein